MLVPGAAAGWIMLDQDALSMISGDPRDLRRAAETTADPEVAPGLARQKERSRV
jgi:hypothetical protein